MSNLDHLDFEPEIDLDSLRDFFRFAVSILPLDVRQAIASEPDMFMTPPMDGWCAVTNTAAGWLFDVSVDSLVTAKSGLTVFRMMAPDGTVQELVVGSL